VRILQITSTALPDGAVAQAYNQVLAATGEIAPLMWALAAGSGPLPPGLMLDANTGTISGPPNTPGTFNFTVQATDSDNPARTDTQALSIRIIAPLVINTGTLPNGVEGVAYNQIVMTTGGLAPVTFAVTAGALPPGTMLNAATGAITGPPTMGGAFNFTITATDSFNPAQTDAQAYTVLILQITTAALPNGTVNVAYNQPLAVTGDVAPVGWTLAPGSGPLPPGLMLDAATGIISGTPTQAGTFNFTAQATDSDSPARTHTRALSITINAAPPAPLVITTGTLPNGVEGAPYNQTVTTTGGQAPVTFAVTAGALPPNVMLNAATGAVTGTPTMGGTFNFTITATDSFNPVQTDAQAYTVLILQITTAALPNGTENVPYNQPLAITGEIAPVNWTLAPGSGPLPPNLLLDPSTGVISGTPTQAGLFGFTVQATDSGNPPRTHTRALTLTIAAPNPPPPPEFNGIVGNSPLLPGNDPGFTYTVSNPATTDAQGLHVDFTLLTIGTFFHATQNFPPGWNCTINLQAIGCDKTTLAAGASDLLPLAVDSAQIDSLAASIDLTAQLTVANPAVNLIRPVSATVGDHPFVLAQKVHSINNELAASFVNTPGLTVAFTITVTNMRSGGGAAAASFSVLDTLPIGFVFVDTNPPGLCNSIGPDQLECPFTNLADGGSFSFQIIVQPVSLGTFVNTVFAGNVQPLQGAGQLLSQTTTTITAPAPNTCSNVSLDAPLGQVTADTSACSGRQPVSCLQQSGNLGGGACSYATCANTSSGLDCRADNPTTAGVSCTAAYDCTDADGSVASVSVDIESTNPLAFSPATLPATLVGGPYNAPTSLMGGKSPYFVQFFSGPFTLDPANPILLHGDPGSFCEGLDLTIASTLGADVTGTAVNGPGDCIFTLFGFDSSSPAQSLMHQFVIAITAVSFAGPYAFALDGGNTQHSFAFDNTGLLVNSDSIVIRPGVFNHSVHRVRDPLTGREYAVVIYDDSSGNSFVRVDEVNADGSLTNVIAETPLPFRPARCEIVTPQTLIGPNSVLVLHDGNGASGTHSFDIAFPTNQPPPQDGQPAAGTISSSSITPLPVAPILVGAQVDDLTAHPSGSYLAAAADGQLRIFVTQPDGSFLEHANSPYVAAGFIFTVEFNPAGTTGCLVHTMGITCAPFDPATGVVNMALSTSVPGAFAYLAMSDLADGRPLIVASDPIMLTSSMTITGGVLTPTGPPAMLLSIAPKLVTGPNGEMFLGRLNQFASTLEIHAVDMATGVFNLLPASIVNIPPFSPDSWVFAWPQ
jgi:uncharacterized repeat protein (TIGR01451 family)